MMSHEVARLAATVRAGQRLSREDALTLYRHAPTPLLGKLADEVRPRKHPERVVTYIIDRNVNYTNVCVAKCNFCAFYRPVGSPDGYVLGFEELFRKIDETIAVGGVQLLLQGGHNPDLPLTWYEDLFRAIKARYPAFKLHALSPPEVIHLSRLSQLPVPAGARTADRGRDGQRAWRRRGNPRRPRSEAAALLRQGDGRRVARRHAPRPPRGPAHDGDDDVRHGRDRRRAPRAPAAAPRPAGRDGRLHGVHHLELSARPYRAGGAGGDRHRLPADAGDCAPGARQLRQPAGVMGDSGRQGRAAEPGLRRQRHGQRDDRGERRPRSRRQLLHGRGRDRPQRRGRWLPGEAPQHALRDSGRSRSSGSARCRGCSS